MIKTDVYLHVHTVLSMYSINGCCAVFVWRREHLMPRLYVCALTHTVRVHVCVSQCVHGDCTWCLGMCGTGVEVHWGLDHSAWIMHQTGPLHLSNIALVCLKLQVPRKSASASCCSNSAEGWLLNKITEITANIFKWIKSFKGFIYPKLCLSGSQIKACNSNQNSHYL